MYLNPSVPVCQASHICSQNVEYILSNEQIVKTFVDSSAAKAGTILERSFCTNCGTRVKTLNPAFPTFYTIGLGLIDGGSSDYLPTDEVFYHNKAKWIAGSEGSTKSDYFPSDLYETPSS